MTDMAKIRREYAALPPFPEFPGEREWPDRLRSWEGFLSFGPMVADDLRDAGPWAGPEEIERRRAMFPELAALVLQAFQPDTGAGTRRKRGTR